MLLLANNTKQHATALILATPAAYFGMPVEGKLFDARKWNQDITGDGQEN